MRTLIPEEKIQGRVAEMAAEISKDYADRDLTVVGVLKGCFIFVSDLTRLLTVPHELDYISVSSYGSGRTSSGVVRLLKDLDTDISGRDVLLAEDIVDTGSSLAYIRKNLETRRPRSLRIAALLDKRADRSAEVDVDYVGFEIPDEFVVGYGMDYAERHRNLPYIGVLEPDRAEAP